MSRVCVDLKDRSYAVVIEHGLLTKFGDEAAEIGRKFLLVSDPTVNDAWGKKVTTALESGGLTVESCVLPCSESEKNLNTVERIYAELFRIAADRRTVVVALGGGVVGDVTGFAAASYLRGIPFVQIPTTLLAQVDASIGGKTGINFQGVKNLVGAFHQPQRVLVDPDFLGTLPLRQFLNGMAEVIKTAVIGDRELLVVLEASKSEWGMGRLTRGEWVIERCVRFKAQVVSQDEREGGLRAILNFGHTLGHAMEAAGNRKLLHGEAIARGMNFAAALAARLGLCGSEVGARIQRLTAAIPCPVAAAALDFEELWTRMVYDKKRSGNRLRMVLLRQIGEPVMEEVSQSMVAEVFHNHGSWWGV